MECEFIAYIDEAGDEGTGPKCKKWLCLCAALYPANTEHRIKNALSDVRALLGKPKDEELHFKDIKHHKRIPYIDAIRTTGVRAICIAIDKERLFKQVRWSKNGKLYWLASRWLVERISWECKDMQRTLGLENRRAALCFANRASVKLSDFVNHLNDLKANPGRGVSRTHISWNSIDPARICSYFPRERAGLQIADAICGAFLHSLEPDQYGYTENRYFKMLDDSGAIAQTKFWPE